MSRIQSICLIIPFLLLTLCHTTGSGQNIRCDEAANILPKIDERAQKIDTQDPEVITLHYLFVLDLLDSIQKFRDDYLPNLHFCKEIDYYPTLHYCNILEKQLLDLKDTLDIQRRRVDTIFYEKAEFELHMTDTLLADYYLDRALQFNRLNTDALIQKSIILFNWKQYDECLKTVHLLYNEAPLKREHEMALADFTMVFYDKLYTTADSLVKIQHESEALTLFLTLESFCHDLPTAYCNDDYYHGIIRSRTGVYKSYLTIAKVAWERKNPQIAYKFLDYAREYRQNNEDEILIPEEFVKFIEEMNAQRYKYNLNP
ncbi:MAG: hypothetical protein J5642_04935 [Bacteroidales bacterium]|nr:hypothetical protein [Bacteroidales bacterium]